MDVAEISWQSAVARLAQERTLAEASARLLKKYGDAAVVDRVSIIYATAKAEYDGVIAGLIVALARGQKAASLPDLQDRLQRGFKKRQAFCNSVQALVPRTEGQKGLIDEVVGSAIGPLVEAVKSILFRAKDDDALTRKTIEIQLEATKWPDFGAIEPRPHAI